jgi:hypothetical protein
MYTHRILDITNQIVKQNRDIDKITSDIRYNCRFRCARITGHAVWRRILSTRACC